MKTKLALVAVFFGGFVLGSLVALRLAAMESEVDVMLDFPISPSAFLFEPFDPEQNSEVTIFHEATHPDCIHGGNSVLVDDRAPCLRVVHAMATALPDAATTETRRVLE